MEELLLPVPGLWLGPDGVPVSDPAALLGMIIMPRTTTLVVEVGIYVTSFTCFFFVLVWPLSFFLMRACPVQDVFHDKWKF